MVNCSACSENYCSKVADIDFGLAEFLGSQTFDLDERAKNKLYTIFLSYFIIWRFLR